MPGDLPILFLDVDGPLIPFGSQHATRNAHVLSGVSPLLARLDPALGPKLAALPCELVWATTWTSHANDVIAPILGLPDLPYVDWSDADEWGELHWKTRHLVAWTEGRPFVWVDDEMTDVDVTWVARHHDAEALLLKVNPEHGLTDADLDVIRTWLAPPRERHRPVAPEPGPPG
ncbi:HAD domain-containing protein [Herbidospora mongoliensis]|uniref:HAD domain-containing protein n=1 Tax=Herbidospora mongoliensis TaxID=688067 RepID=UPI00083582D4|nr:HAD domain-containing protein [Herbidospora mongoliensis]